MDIIEKEGLSVPEAVFSACMSLGIDEKDAQVQVLSAPGARRVKVRVGKPGVAMPAPGRTEGLAGEAAPTPAPAMAMASSEAPVAAVAAPDTSYAKPAAYAPKTSNRPQPSLEQAEALRVDFAKALELMGTPSQVELKEHAGNRILNIVGPKEGLLIGKRGMTLDALQHLALEMLAKATGQADLYIVVDVADYRYRQEKKLMDKALELAERVRSQGGQETLGPLDPAERRIIHLSLKPFDDIETFSVGDGVSKKVVIQKKR